MFLCKSMTAMRRALLVGMVAFVAQAATAATITVNSLADPGDGTTCTLRQAISAANTNAAVGTCTPGDDIGGSDAIVFSGTLNLTPATPGTITLDQSSMNEAPANFGIVPPVWLLVISTPMSITGPGSGALTVNGGGLGTTAIGRRTLLVTDGIGSTDLAIAITGMSFKEGRSVGGGGGCIFARESLTLTDVRFEACEAVGSSPSNTVGGGALGVAVTGVTDLRPNVALTNVKFIGNRSVHGSAGAANTSCCGAASLGGGTTNLIGNVTIADSQFIGNSAEGVGALRIGNGGNVSITNTQLISNTATSGNVGAMSISGMTGTVTLNGGGVLGNASLLGRRGGVQISTVGTSVASGNVVSISDWSFIGNLAASDLGGLDILTDNFDANGNCLYNNLKNVNLNGVYFEKNIANKATGGLRIACSGNATLTDIDMLNNEVGGLSVAGSGGNSAGQIFDVATLTMSNIRIISNRTFAGTITPPATQNGGFAVFTIIGPPFASPSLTYPLAHSFTGTRFLVKDNWASENEAGVSLRPNGAGVNYSLSDSSFVGNRAKGITGIFLNATGNYTVSNSTFSGNTSTAGAGPVFVNTHSSAGPNAVTLRGITSARNSASTAPISVGAFNPAGGATTASAAVAISNTILGQYQFTNGAPGSFPTQAGVTYTVANSIVETYDGNNMPAGICGVAGVLCNVDAKLEGLADNGGSPITSYTHALRAGSPALDAGSGAGAPAFDQRGTGFPRIVNGAIDIGAFESPVLAAVLPCKLDMDGDNQVRANKEGLVLLRAMLGFSGSNVVNGTGISQGQWDAVRNNLNANCGTSFAP